MGPGSAIRCGTLLSATSTVIAIENQLLGFSDTEGNADDEAVAQLEIRHSFLHSIRAPTTTMTWGQLHTSATRQIILIASGLQDQNQSTHAVSSSALSNGGDYTFDGMNGSVRSYQRSSHGITHLLLAIWLDLSNLLLTPTSLLSALIYLSHLRWLHLKAAWSANTQISSQYSPPSVSRSFWGCCL